jgi:DNA-directed RNA polymerase specialized sigma24 family protein
MATPKKMDAQEELVRLKVLQLRRTAKSQNEMIAELDKAGFGQTRIADLLGTTANTVNVALSKAKKQAKKKGQSGGDAEPA